jgi:hypothetical protein
VVQKNGGKFHVLIFAMPFTKSPTGYFTHQSPDFINYKGQPLNVAQQVEALALAQSIGA